MKTTPSAGVSRLLNDVLAWAAAPAEPHPPYPTEAERAARAQFWDTSGPNFTPSK